MPHYSYTYYDNVSPVPYVVFLGFFTWFTFHLILLIFYCRITKSRIAKIGKFVVSKILLSSIFVSATITVAQILFGFRAVKQKRRDPSIIIINGRHYKLNGFTLGSIVYYNCITIYIIIFVSLQFMIRNTPWSVEECNSGADCFYLNYSAIPSYSQESPPGIPIENCTLENDYDENDVNCYSIGFHPAVGIALLGGFINIVTPLLFAFYVGIQAWIFQRMSGKTMQKMNDKFKRKSYKFRCIVIIKVILCFKLFVFIVLSTPIVFVILVYLNYETPRDRQSSFEKLFSSESFLGQSIAFCCVNTAFIGYPIVAIERYSIDVVHKTSIDAIPAATQKNNNTSINNEDESEDEDGDSINQNETVNFARKASSRRGASTAESFL